MNLFKFSLLTIFIFTHGAIANQCNNALMTVKAKAGVNPYKKAITATMKKTGALNKRAENFAAKWPSNIKIVEDVKMKFTDANGNGERSRKMVVISLNGLSDTDSEKLLADYIDYMSWNSISFPLGEQGGHLHTRIGKIDMDDYFGFSTNDYRWPSSTRLESFVELNSAEYKNVRQYVENMEIDRSKILGNSSYEGAHPVEGATLAGNQAATGTGHNCTSWIATAPIGENGQTLKSIVGADSWDVHRNPGWWTAFIQTRGKNDRVPFVVYITRDSMNDAVAKTQQEFFNWNYGLH